MGLLVDLAGTGAEVGVAELGDDEPVCHCNGVSKGTLVRTVHNGATDVRAVMDATRAGRGCGTCRGLVRQVVDWATAQKPPDDGLPTPDPTAGTAAGGPEPLVETGHRDRS